jgi:hypothetical protein
MLTDGRYWRRIDEESFARIIVSISMGPLFKSFVCPQFLIFFFFFFCVCVYIVIYNAFDAV